MKRVLDSNPILQKALAPIQEEAERVRAALKVSNTATSGLEADRPMREALEYQLKGVATPLPGGEAHDLRQTAMIESLQQAVSALRALEISYRQVRTDAEKDVGPQGRVIAELDANIKRQSEADSYYTRGLELLGAPGQQLFDAAIAKTILSFKAQLEDLIDAKAVASVIKDASPGIAQLEKSIAALKKNKKPVSDVVVDAPLFTDPATRHLKGLKLAPLLRGLAKLLRAEPMEPKKLLTNMMLPQYAEGMAEHLDELADTAALGRKVVYLGMTVEAQNCGGYIRELFDALQSAEHRFEQLQAMEK